MIFMTFLQSELKDVKPDEWDKKYLSYDNMYVYYSFIEIATGLIFLQVQCGQIKSNEESTSTRGGYETCLSENPEGYRPSL